MIRLTLSDREKIDQSDDMEFYKYPRYCYHLDQGFRSRLTKLYEETISENSIICDFMSSWVSHLPESRNYKRIIAHGINREELEANKVLDSFWVQNLNVNTVLPIEDNFIDYALMTAGWQYLEYPEKISEEILKKVQPNGKIIISFSNRAFWSKAPRIWSENDDLGRVKYIESVLKDSGWRNIQSIMEETKLNTLFGLMKSSGDPFFAVIAEK